MTTVNLDRDFETILICAVRYALRRHTYMPSLVADYFTKLAPTLSPHCITTAWRDVCQQLEWEDYTTSDHTWLEFIEDLRRLRPECEPAEFREEKI